MASGLQDMLHKMSLTLYLATYPFHYPIIPSPIHSIAVPSYLSYDTEAQTASPSCTSLV